MLFAIINYLNIIKSPSNVMINFFICVLLALFLLSSSFTIDYSMFAYPNNASINDNLTESNNTLYSDYFKMDENCVKTTNQYIVTLNHETTNSSASLNNPKDILDKVKKSGINVTNDFTENLGIFTMSSLDSQLLVTVIEDLEKDPRVLSVEKEGCVSPF